MEVVSDMSHDTFQVLNHFRSTCPCCRRAQLRRRSRVPSTSVTQYTTYDDDREVRASVRSRGLSGTNENGSSHYEKETLELEEMGGATNGKAVKKGGYMPVPTSAGGEGLGH